MTDLQNYVGLMGNLLLLTAVATRFVSHPRFHRRVVAITIAAMIFIAIIPISDVLVIVYVRGVITDLSITSMILLCYSITHAYSGHDYLDRKNIRILSYVLPVVSLVMYPMSLGLGMWDPYTLGYGNMTFFTLLLIMAFLLFFSRNYWMLGVMLAAIAAYLLSLLPSDNLWDYFMDPWLVIVLWVILLRSIINRGTEAL